MKLLIGIIVIGLLISLIPIQTSAGIVQCGASEDNPATPGIIESKPCEFCDIFKLINNIVIFFLAPSPSVNNGFAVVPLLATLFILIGGFYILVAGGSPVEVFKDTGAKGSPLALKQGKAILGAVVTGLLIVYIAWVVVNSILTFLGVAQWTGLTDRPGTPEIEGWWQIQCGI